MSNDLFDKAAAALDVSVEDIIGARADGADLIAVTNAGMKARIRPDGSVNILSGSGDLQPVPVAAPPLEELTGEENEVPALEPIEPDDGVPDDAPAVEPEPADEPLPAAKKTRAKRSSAKRSTSKRSTAKRSTSKKS